MRADPRSAVRWARGPTKMDRSTGEPSATMWRATLKGIAGRRIRLALTTLAVVLGVAFVSGTYVLTDTLNRSFHGVFGQTLAGVDLVVRRALPFGGGGTADRQRFPDTTVARTRGIPGVANA